jgi:hypothetical protein
VQTHQSKEAGRTETKPEETRDTLYAGGIYLQPVGAYAGLDFLRVAPPSTLTLLNSQTPNDLNLFCSLQLSFTPSFGGAFFFGSITPFPTKPLLELTE